jgi:hypothetical protein
VCEGSPILSLNSCYPQRENLGSESLIRISARVWSGSGRKKPKQKGEKGRGKAIEEGRRREGRGIE